MTIDETLEMPNTFFADKLNELTVILEDKAKEIGAQSKNLAYLLLREKAYENCKIAVDMARMGYTYFVPMGFMTFVEHTIGILNGPSFCTPPKKIPVCVLFYKNKNFRADYFLRKIFYDFDAKHVEIYYIGDTRAMETINVKIISNNITCQTDNPSKCVDVKNCHMLDNKDFANYLLNLITENNKWSYDELNKRAFETIPDKAVKALEVLNCA